MARDKKNQPNINNTDVFNYPNARIKDSTGIGDGTPIDESVYGDIHEFFAKMMRLYNIPYNDVPDNETAGYQYIEAARALATKNDFILNLTSESGKLVVPVKIGKMLVNEQIVCKAAVDKAAETSVVGSDTAEIAATFIGDFKTGEYVRLIKTASNIVFIRLVDFVNLDSAVDNLAYLKAATYAQEIAGASDAVATTPLNNLLAFVERVNGATSAGALAIANVRNGLMSAEDKAFIENFISSERNYGTINGVNIGGQAGGTTWPVTGDIISAAYQSGGNGNMVIRVTVANEMDTLNYEVNISLESLSGDPTADNDVGTPAFRKISKTVFDLTIDEFATRSQNLNLHVSVKQR